MDIRLGRANFGPERADLKPERADFRPERAGFRPERAWGGGRMDGQTNEQKSRTSFPSGPLPCLSFRLTTKQSRATGIADHVLPLGDLFFIVILMFVEKNKTVKEVDKEVRNTVYNDHQYVAVFPCLFV